MLPLVCQALPIVITAHQVRCIGAWMRFGLGMGWFCLPLAPYWLYGLRACVCFGSSALPHAGTVTGSCGKRNRILFRLQELDVGGPGGRKMFSAFLIVLARPKDSCCSFSLTMENSVKLVGIMPLLLEFIMFFWVFFSPSLFVGFLLLP